VGLSKNSLNVSFKEGIFNIKKAKKSAKKRNLNTRSRRTNANRILSAKFPPKISITSLVGHPTSANTRNQKSTKNLHSKEYMIFGTKDSKLSGYKKLGTLLQTSTRFSSGKRRSEKPIQEVRKARSCIRNK
jgi:hypothetical protein